MQHWRFGRVMFSLLAILVMVVSLNILGCSDDDDGEGEQDVTAADLENFRFTMDAGIIDPALAGQQIVLAFGEADGNELRFTITGLRDDFRNPVGIGGNAVVESVDFFITVLTLAGEQVEAVTINGKTFVVDANNAAFTLDITIERVGDDIIIRITNPDIPGLVVTFIFREGDTGATGATGSGGE
jgi:hypothetical protein